MELRKGDIRIRPLSEDDFSLMFQWLSDPRVLEFYGGRDLAYTPELLREHYEESFEDEGFRVILEYRGIPVGYGQIYRLSGEMFGEYAYSDPGFPVYAMDQFIGEPEYWNRGIGTEYLKAVCEYLRDEKGTGAVLVDPHQENRRAIRAYEKAGFRIIGELPAHELHEGKMVDCFLMERRFDE